MQDKSSRPAVLVSVQHALARLQQQQQHPDEEAEDVAGSKQQLATQLQALHSQLLE